MSVKDKLGIYRTFIVDHPNNQISQGWEQGENRNHVLAALRTDLLLLSPKEPNAFKTKIQAQYFPGCLVSLIALKW